MLLADIPLLVPWSRLYVFDVQKRCSGFPVIPCRHPIQTDLQKPLKPSCDAKAEEPMFSLPLGEFPGPIPTIALIGCFNPYCSTFFDFVPISLCRDEVAIRQLRHNFTRNFGTLPLIPYQRNCVQM